ncbi:molybdenum cofactor biosynthesis protein MoaE [Celeribacter halophilus]|uniref:molybdenum cofactor biosynthesis protein MoaE n=1 Tax=Celeribacter halophilus TaxID=576117 RepID=UPI001C095611|nr:molybdenum cofactor biosynthesis protein MoaE [Celeribacter halophilus]MBU2891450.1 molybdenum cofactor biosynthesis protein MoaE [Celeribacter halophilus]MDO6509608.1 molybdenum cofactor biosynthesis protein MoaE [Celeribacter halophilus]
MRVSVQSEDFDLADELKGFGKQPDTGATVSFTGLVRDDTGTLDHMEIEHYPGMCDAAITEIAEEASARWALTDCLVIHRFGKLRPGDQIMMVATAARHRVEAFEAAEFLMDYLKSRAPFWKKEVMRDGADWVAAKDADEDALNRW